MSSEQYQPTLTRMNNKTLMAVRNFRITFLLSRLCVKIGVKPSLCAIFFMAIPSWPKSMSWQRPKHAQTRFDLFAPPRDAVGDRGCVFIRVIRVIRGNSPCPHSGRHFAYQWSEPRITRITRIKHSQVGTARRAVRPVDASARRPYPQQCPTRPVRVPVKGIWEIRD